MFQEDRSPMVMVELFAAVALYLVLGVYSCSKLGYFAIRGSAVLPYWEPEQSSMPAIALAVSGSGIRNPLTAKINLIYDYNYRIKYK